VAGQLARTSISPNALTWIGFFITVFAAVLIAIGQTFVGGLVVLLAGLFDLMDGGTGPLQKAGHLFGALA